MLNKLKTNPIILIVMLASGLMIAACSPSAEKLNQDGNQAYVEQAYLEALEAYQSAQIESPELAEPYYNAANTFYRQGQYDQALEQLQQALQYAEQKGLAENSFFNLGNNLYNTQELETAIEAYKQSLLLNPEDQDAKYNLELALQQQQEQQEQQQQEESQNEENQEENQDQSQDGESQENEQEQNQDQNQNGENQDEQNQEQDEDQSENQDQQNEGDSQEEKNQDGEQGQPSQVPPPGQRMTEEQARQLLAALAEDMETLQERLGQILFVQKPPPVQDW